jgi:hypothetical protein
MVRAFLLRRIMCEHSGPCERPHNSHSVAEDATAVGSREGRSLRFLSSLLLLRIRESSLRRRQETKSRGSAENKNGVRVGVTHLDNFSNAISLIFGGGGGGFSVRVYLDIRFAHHKPVIR